MLREFSDDLRRQRWASAEDRVWEVPGRTNSDVTDWDTPCGGGRAGHMPRLERLCEPINSGVIFFFKLGVAAGVLSISKQFFSLIHALAHSFVL